jgi:hypothetical protein
MGARGGVEGGMKMRPFIIDDTTRARVAEVVVFAQGNWYRPGQSENPPGDDPRHTIVFPFGYRCVFSITYFRGKSFRHLFGFTGWSVDIGGDAPADWMLDINQAEHCCVVVQDFKP